MDPQKNLDPSRSPSSVRVAAGARVAVRRQGVGPTIVCLHAVGHDGHDFDALASRLGHDFEFVSVDWPGHGDSPADTLQPGSRRYGAILVDLLERLDLRDVVVLGNSVGGGAGIVAAAMPETRLRGLVLCDTSGLVRHSRLVRLVCRRQARLFARGEAGDPGFLADYRRLYERKILPGAAVAGRREEIVRMGPSVAPLLRRAWIGFGEPEADLRALAAQVRCPVLLAWAKQDRVIPWAFSRAGARRFPDHRVEFFEAGHSAFLEAPAAFDGALLRFMASLPVGEAEARDAG